MASRVAVDITVRDLTRGELNRMRQNFRHTGRDLENLVTSRTRANFERFQQSLRSTRSDLSRLRGAIPDDEFERLDASVRSAQRRLNRGLGRMTVTQLQQIEREVRDVIDAVGDLDRNDQIRIRVDDAELRRQQARLERWRREQERRRVRIQADIDLDRNRVNRSIRNTLTSPIRTFFSSVGGIMSDGIGQGIISGFQTAGPVGVAILVGVLAGAVSAVGAAVAGLLVFAFGAAFVGLGVFMASKTKEVKDAWKETADSIKKSFEHAGDPLIPSIKRALDLLSKLAADFAPKLKSSLEAAAPFLDRFVEKIDKGLRGLGKNSFDDIMKGFNSFLEAFGPQFQDFLEELGKSLGTLARTVGNNSTEIAIALRGVLGVINLLIDAINFLAQAWVFMFHGAISLAAGFVDAWASTVDSFLSGVGMILEGILSISSLIPGMGDAADEAKRRFDDFRAATVNNLHETANGIRNLSTTIQDQNRRNVLKADIAQLNAKVNEAKAKLQTVTDKKVQAQIRADIADLIAKRNRAQQELNALNGKTVTTYIITKNIQVGATAGGIAPGGGGFPAGKATGGVAGAAVGGARSNMTLVGEQGPELVNLPAGSHVRSNPDTRRFFDNQTGGGPSQFVIKSSGRRVDDMLIEILREAIKQRGGNPVTVLGG